MSRRSDKQACKPHLPGASLERSLGAGGCAPDSGRKPRQASSAVWGKPHLLPGVLLWLAVSVLFSCSSVQQPETAARLDPAATEFFRAIPEDPSHKYVHMMHLDGFRPDLFKALLDMNKLPTFQFLAERGKYTTDATTVDKSETMKVVESYLTSRRDTYVTAWWQFSRDIYDFRNFWINPVQVANYGLGLEFPTYPTVLDVVAGPPQRQSVMSGFALHRRGVPFDKYARAYVEGATAAVNHTYFNQLDATIRETARILAEAAGSKDPAQIPRLTTSLLASADEMAHWKGVVPNPKDGINSDEYCFERNGDVEARKNDPLDIVFDWVDQYSDVFQDLSDTGRSYFTRIERVRDRSLGHPIGVLKTRKLCFWLPQIEAFSEFDPSGPTTIKSGKMQLAQPYYVLGMMMVDFQLGRLIDAMRSVRFDAQGGVSETKDFPRGLTAYMKGGTPENSLFEKTLFLFYADHGMMDSKYKMLNAASKDTDYIEKLPGDFIKLLNDGLGLQNAAKDTPAGDGALLGIDDALIPRQLARPYAGLFDDKSPVAPNIQQAKEWAEPLTAQLATDFAYSVKQKVTISWLLEFFGIHIVANKIDQKVDEQFNTYHDQILDVLTPLKLLSDKAYMAAELQKKKDFYDSHIRLVYGGGARNNAEIFLPDVSSGKPNWGRRPGMAQIMTYRPGGPDKPTVLDTLKKNPGVGLIFVRMNNDSISSAPGAPLPSTLDILVTDPFDNRGTIRVHKDAPTGQFVFSYRVEANSPEDPLGLNFGDRKWHSGTYNEWVDRSVKQNDYYRNAVAGMGAYLYSKNPSIGDITVMHRQGWNFGDNSGGHGGLHREEKRTLMMVSGPAVKPADELFATSHYSVKDPANPESPVVYSAAGQRVYPTVLDPGPTALQWLGYGDHALGEFARRNFASYLQEWTSEQYRSCSSNVVQLLVESLHHTEYEDQYHFSAEDLKGSIEEIFTSLCKALPSTIPALPDFRNYEADGNLLVFQD